MRRLVAFTVLAIALGVPAMGLAAGDGGNSDGTLSIKNGLGKAVLFPFNGSAVGRVAHGKVVIVDPVFADGEGSDTWGCDNKSPDKSDTTIVCTGDNLRFRAVGGKYKIIVKGSGIYLSAVGRGWLVLDGRGDDADVVSDGVFSLNDSSYHSLPDEAKGYPLAAPTGNG